MPAPHDKPNPKRRAAAPRSTPPAAQQNVEAPKTHKAPKAKKAAVKTPAMAQEEPPVPQKRTRTNAVSANPPGKAVAPIAPPAARQRDRSASEERILAAVGSVLARDGFGAVGINAIAREAGIDKVLIYRYFGGLPELLQAWGASGQFWPGVAELLGDDADAIRQQPPAERFAQFFERFIDALRARPLTIEILAAEIVESNELTRILEAQREHWGEQAEALLGADMLVQKPHLRGVALLLIGGVQYLLVRSRTLRVFGGQDLHDDATWAAMKASIRATAEALL